MAHGLQPVGKGRNTIGSFKLVIGNAGNIVLSVKYSPLAPDNGYDLKRRHSTDDGEIGRIDYCKNEKTEKGGKTLYTEVSPGEIEYIVDCTDIVLTAEERRKLELPDSYTHLGWEDQLPNPEIIQSSYLLLPYSHFIAKSYVELREALKKGGYPIGRLVARNVDRLTLVEPRYDVLLMHFLRYPADVTDAMAIKVDAKTDRRRINATKRLIDEIYSAEHGQFNYRNMGSLRQQALASVVLEKMELNQEKTKSKPKRKPKNPKHKRR